jgi:PAS domain S-box-containing protein
MSRFSLVQRFAIWSFVFILLLNLAGTSLLLRYMQTIIVEREARVVSDFLRVAITQHGLTENFRKGDFSGNSFGLRSFLGELLMVAEIVRLKIYDSQGVILWSDTPFLIGAQFADNQDLAAALRGQIGSSLRPPHKTEHVHEKSYDRVMEIYTPVFEPSSGELIGVLETYKHPWGLLASLDKTRRITWIVAVLGSGLLYAGMLFIAFVNHRREVRLQEDVRESHRRYMDLIENSPEMIHQVDRERRFLHVNGTETRILGYGLDEMKGMKLEDLAPQERRDELIAHFGRILSGKKSTVETQFITKSGEIIDVEINETGFFDPVGKQLVQTRAFIRDISKRKKAEREVRFLNEYYYAILGSMNSYVRVINADGVVEFENRPAGYAAANERGSKCDLSGAGGSPCSSRFAQQTLESGIPHGGEERTSDDCFYAIAAIPMKSRDGTISAIEIVTDITDRKKLEQELIQQAKMAGMGLLATGLAHEIGNPIGIVEGAVQFCLEKLNPEDSLREYLEVIQRNIAAADRTIKALLRFARPAEHEPAEVNLLELLRETGSVVAPEFLQRGIALRTVFPERAPCIVADRANLQQVFVNILLNAVEALSQGGEVSVTVRESSPPGEVEIAFADNGPGIPAEHLPDIFSPFFTTKEEGTGLGLSICQRVVESHGGRMSAANLPLGGAQVTVWLPSTPREARSHERS